MLKSHSVHGQTLTPISDRLSWIQHGADFGYNVTEAITIFRMVDLEDLGAFIANHALQRTE